MRIGNISRRPASISKQNTSLESPENFAKFSVGPTSEIPGPTLLSVVSTELNVVEKSKLFSDTMRTDTTKISIYAKK